MLPVDSQLREPDRNELFAKAARCIGEADAELNRRHGEPQRLLVMNKLIESQQAMLMLIVKIERTQDNLVRSRTNEIR